jgi:hypothetical protein
MRSQYTVSVDEKRLGDADHGSESSMNKEIVMRPISKAPRRAGVVARAFDGSASEWVLELLLVAATFAAVGAVLGD